MDAPQHDFRVKLRSSITPADVVVFEATPELTEQRTINYKTVDPIHAPGQIYAYVNTSSRIFSISNARLISRTSEEAGHNLRMLQLLRSWTMPEFGTSTSTNVDNRGRPPTVLYLSAYSLESAGAETTSVVGQLQHISRVPVVIQNMSIPYPSDVDYIPTADENGAHVPMPTIMVVDLQLAETHSAREYEGFNLALFKQGLLGGF